MGSSLHPLAALRGARPRRVPVLRPAACRNDRRRARRRDGPGGASVRARRASTTLEAGAASRRPARRRRWYDDGAGRWRCCSPRAPTSTTSSRPSSPTRSSGTSCTPRLRRLGLPPSGGAGRRAVRGSCSAGRETTGSASRRRGAATFGDRSARSARPRSWTCASACSAARDGGYARVTRRWWAPIRAAWHEPALERRPMYFVSSNTHSLVNLLSGDGARARGRDRRLARADGPRTSAPSSRKLARGRTRGSWDNFLYFAARDFFEPHPEGARGASAEDGASARRHRAHPARTALGVSAQVIDARAARPRGARPAAGRRRREQLAAPTR